MVANVILYELKKAKKTQQWLADNLKVSYQTVNFWCTNKYQPSLDYLDKIGELLDLDPASLVLFDSAKGIEECLYDLMPKKASMMIYNLKTKGDRDEKNAKRVAEYRKRNNDR